MREARTMQQADSLFLKPWRLLGFGFYQAWVLIAVLSTSLFPHTDFFINNIGIIRCYFSLSIAVCLLVLGFTYRKIATPKKRRIALFTAAAFSALGTMLIGLPFASEQLLFAATTAGITFTGMGNALIVLAWGMLWSKTDVDRVGLHIAVSNAFAGCIYLGTVMLPGTLATAIATMLPLCSVAILLSCRDEPKRQQEEAQTQPKRLMWKAASAIAIIPLAFGIARALSSPNGSAAANIQYNMVLGMTLFAIALAVITTRAPRQRMTIRLYRFVSPLMVIGFAALAFMPGQYLWLPFAAIMCGFYSFEGLVWLLQPECAFRTKASSVSLFGWGRCLFHFFGFIGAAIGFLFSSESSHQATSIICFAMIVILVGLSAFIFTEHDLRRFIGETAAQKAERQPEAGLTQMADEFGLSKREAEVLALLAKGRSAPFIAEALFISKGTAKTHVRHVYEKMNVHSKQELLDLIDSRNPASI